ncbi:MAG: M20 family metallopeptidase [Candidatus Kariarchaeaceae archaeon]
MLNFAINPEELINLTSKLVQINTENPPGSNLEIISFLTNFVEEWGLSAHTQKINDHMENLIVKVGSGKKKVILCGHLDTVPAGKASLWTESSAFSGEIINGRLYGRGSTDMKAGCVSMLGVLKAYHERIDELNDVQLIFCGTADEEVAMTGSKHLKNSDIVNNADFLLIAEPTDLRVGIAEKGALWLKTTVKGKASHGSTPELGVNAIEGATQILPIFKELLPTQEDPLLGPSTLNIGTISGGTKINVVPEECEIKCDYRLIPAVDTDKLKAQLMDQITKLAKTSPWRVELEELHSIPAISSSDHPMQHNMLKLANQALELETEFIGLTYGTDAATIVPGTNLPFTIFGPGGRDVLHKSNEFVNTIEIPLATEIVCKALISTYGI